MADASAPCPRCGRRVEAAVPDLDLPVRPAKGGASTSKPAMKAVSAASAPPPAAHVHGANDDPGARNLDMDAFGPGSDAVSLDLDLGTGPPLVSGVSAPSAPKVPAAQGPARVAAPGGRLGAPPAPQATPTVPERAPAPLASTSGANVDPYEARALADYGEAPAQWWKAPLYAYRVLRRRPELKRLADAKRQDAERAQNAAEEALQRFAEIVRPDAERLPRYAEALGGVRATEAVFRERDAVLASESDAHKARQAGREAKITELEAQLGQVQTEERQIAGELAEADTLVKRAEARAKRAEIEVRNATAQQSQVATTPGAAAPKGPGA